MSETQGHPAIAAFVATSAQIEELLGLDAILLGLPIKILEKVQYVQNQLKPPLQNAGARVDKVLKLLQGVRDNASVAPKLQVLRNQCVVLAVSHFSSAVRAVFIERLSILLREGAGDALLKETLAVSVGDLLETISDPAPRVAEALILKKNISFQDMKSIARAYSEILGQSLQRDAVVNDIVVAHACRHAIVHNGSVVDAKLLNQIRDASPRHLQQTLTKGQALVFSDVEVRTVTVSMVEYLYRLLC